MQIMLEAFSDATGWLMLGGMAAIVVGLSASYLRGR